MYHNFGMLLQVLSNSEKPKFQLKKDHSSKFTLVKIGLMVMYSFALLMKVQCSTVRLPFVWISDFAFVLLLFKFILLALKLQFLNISLLWISPFIHMMSYGLEFSEKTQSSSVNAAFWPTCNKGFGPLFLMNWQFFMFSIDASSILIGFMPLWFLLNMIFSIVTFASFLVFWMNYNLVNVLITLWWYFHFWGI